MHRVWTSGKLEKGSHKKTLMELVNSLHFMGIDFGSKGLDKKYELIFISDFEIVN